MQSTQTTKTERHDLRQEKCNILKMMRQRRCLMASDTCLSRFLGLPQSNWHDVCTCLSTNLPMMQVTHKKTRAMNLSGHSSDQSSITIIGRCGHRLPSQPFAAPSSPAGF